MHPAARNRSTVIAVKHQFLDCVTYPQIVWVLPPLSQNMGGIMSDRLGSLPNQLIQFLDLDDQDYELFNDFGLMI